jgi:hypothetical protein
MNLRETGVGLEDLRYIAAHLRPADALEIEAYGFESPMSAFLAAIDCEGRVHVLRDQHERPVCLYGLHRTGQGFNAPWMMGTTLINSHRRDFWLHSQRAIREFDQEGLPLFNFVHRENDAALAWLSRLGFEIHYDEPVTEHTGAVFYPFERTTNVLPH